MKSIIALPEEANGAVASSTHARIGVLAPASFDVAETIIGKAGQLAQGGNRVTIVSASRWNAARLARLVRESEAPSQVRVVFVQDLALGLLADARIQQAVKRADRVLDRNEMDVLAEDIKVTGLKPRRLKEMLKFFYKSIADCTAEQEGWFISQEEATVYAMLEENLEARRACLPCEPAAKAYQGMIAAGVEPEKQAFIVDDFGSLSKSAQRLVERLSQGDIVAFGNDAFRLAADEPYPSPEGMRAFLDDERTAVIEVRPKSAERHPAETLPTPLMEFDHIASFVSDQLANGITPDELAIAAPNPTWGRQIARALTEKGIASVMDLPAKKAKGDPREANDCVQIKLNAFAKLLCDPQDFTAYRTFIGAGDWLLRSDGFLELLAYAREHDLEARDAIKIMCEPGNLENTTVSFKKLVGPIREYDELVKTWKTGTAEQIRESMKQHGMPLAERGELLGKDSDVPDVDAFLASFAPSPIDQRDGRVLIAPYSRIYSHSCKTLVIAGMIDGFMPERDAVDDSFDRDHRTKALERDRRKLESIEAIASQHIYFTNFDHDAIENTAALHMVTTRIYQKDGRRMARVSPSSLLA